MKSMNIVYVVISIPAIQNSYPMKNFRSTLDPDHRSPEYFLDNVKRMGSLYDLDVTYLKEMNEFQSFLDKYDTNTTDSVYNIRRRMKLVSLLTLKWMCT